MQRKAALFPGQWNLSPLRLMKTITNSMTRTPHATEDIETLRIIIIRAGARHVLSEIAVPTLIITAQDDPLYSGINVRQPGSKTIATLRSRCCGTVDTVGFSEAPVWRRSVLGNRIIEWISSRT